MALIEFVKESLPTPWSKGVATVSWTLAFALLFLPDLSSKIGLDSAKQIPLMPRLVAASTILFLGSSICLALVVRHFSSLDMGEESTHRKIDLLVSWRKMVTDVAEITDTKNPLTFYLERHNSFPGLKPHLSKNTISLIYRQNTFVVGSTLDASLLAIQEDIAALEKQWGLP